MDLIKRETSLVKNQQVVAILGKKLRETNRNPADLLAMPEYRDNRDLLLSIAISSFLQQIKSEQTYKYYQDVIQHFSDFIKATRQASLLDAIGWDVAAWREDLSKTGGLLNATESYEGKRAPNSPASVETKTSALSSFYSYIARPGFYNNDLTLMSQNPVSALPKRHNVEKYGNSQKIGLKAFKAVLDQVNLGTVQGLRDYALLYGYYITGRRHTEWASLQWENINWNTQEPTYVYVGKGGKTFRDAIPEGLLNILLSYLRSRWGENYKTTIKPETYLFTSLQSRHSGRNEPLVESSVLRLIKSYATTANLSQPDKTIIHSLRHLHAETYLKAGANVETVRARLQHQKLDTTQVYASTMDNQKNPLADKLVERFKEAEINPIAEPGN